MLASSSSFLCLDLIFLTVTTRCYASMVCAVVMFPSVRPFAWLSHASIVPEWLNIGSVKQRRMLARLFDFSTAKDRSKIPMVSPNRGGIPFCTNISIYPSRSFPAASLSNVIFRTAVQQLIRC